MQVRHFKPQLPQGSTSPSLSSQTTPTPIQAFEPPPAPPTAPPWALLRTPPPPTPSLGLRHKYPQTWACSCLRQAREKIGPARTSPISLPRATQEAHLSHALPGSAKIHNGENRLQYTHGGAKRGGAARRGGSCKPHGPSSNLDRQGSSTHFTPDCLLGSVRWEGVVCGEEVASGRGQNESCPSAVKLVYRLPQLHLVAPLSACSVSHPLTSQYLALLSVVSSSCGTFPSDVTGSLRRTPGT